MCARWHIISKASSELPAAGQEIYCCIVDGDNVSAVRKVIADLKCFEDLLYLHPKWQILWQSMPPLPNPPSLSAVLSFRKEAPHG